MRLTYVLLLGLLLSACTKVEIEERFIFMPVQLAPLGELPNSRLLDVPLAEGVTLNALHLDHPESQTTLIYFRGNGETMWNRRSYARFQQWYALGVDVFAYDYRGYGKSTDTSTVANLYADAEAMLAYVQREFNPTEVILYGHSLGTAVVTRLGKAGHGDRLVLESGFVGTEGTLKHFKKQLSVGNLFLNLKSTPALDFTQEADLASIRQPLLILHGKEDPIFPPAFAERLHAAAASPEKHLHILDSAQHNDVPLQQSTNYREALAAFLAGER